MTPQIIEFSTLVERLKQPLKTLILYHRSPDPDAIGSAFSLKQILKALGVEAYCIGDCEISDRLSFLMQGTQASTLGQNIPASFRPERIISVDVASPQQLGLLEGKYASLVDLAIDHHDIHTLYAKETYENGKAAATAEILFDVATALENEGYHIFNKNLATTLYAGISADTGCFRYSNASAKTHTCASKLIELGIDSADINRFIFDSHPLSQLKAQAKAIEKLIMYYNGKVAVIPFSYALKQELEVTDDDLQTLVDVARSIQGVEVGIAIKQPTNENVYRVSMRSNSDFDVAAICQQFQGGGHIKAAGCTVVAKDMASCIHQLILAIDEKMN